MKTKVKLSIYFIISQDGPSFAYLHKYKKAKFEDNLYYNKTQIHFLDVWVGSTTVPKGGAVGCKMQMCPRVDISDEVASELGVDWIDVTPLFDDKDHLIIYAELSFLWKNPVILKSYNVDGRYQIL